VSARGIGKNRLCSEKLLCSSPVLLWNSSLCVVSPALLCYTLFRDRKLSPLYSGVVTRGDENLLAEEALEPA